jgi:isopentenyl-diphosphate delta-isomerase
MTDANIPELVVLVDESNTPIGTMPKSEVHGPNTPLHRAFSAFIFNSKGQILLQQRSHLKKTWPLVWSNSCCGHPLPDESNLSAAKRRLLDELGLKVTQIEEVSPYRYCFTRFGVMENEICPILVGFTDLEPIPNPDEVENTVWMDWQDFLSEIKNNTDGKWSEWCVEESQILEQNLRFQELLAVM